MKVDLTGTWRLWLEEDALVKDGREKELAEYLSGVLEGRDCAYKERPETEAVGEIAVPGILQGQGYGNPITGKTPWVSGLHDPFWYSRKEYQYGQENGCKVPFLSQPPRHYIGRAWYEREICIPGQKDEGGTGENWILRIELTRWGSDLWVDGEYRGSDCSLCTAHEIIIGKLTPGLHRITVCIDNRFQYPYRPDGHAVSDALGASWNGMAGEVALLTEDEKEKETEEKRRFAADHPRHMEVKDGKFYVDGRPEYFRGTHFGGDYPLTGYPSTDLEWWRRLMETVKEWGLNFIRCHSCCPPEAAFCAADEAGVYLQPECGMWNTFEEGLLMNDVLRDETRRILRQFGHHPSFVLFSPSNEPGGQWYGPLRRWVSETRDFDKELGYGGRRLYTAQSGWFYDVPPKDITGTDYICFHRSAFGPIEGGNIRNYEGWKGRDYSPSIEGVTLPVICHEMGQWCAYPDYTVMDKFTGYLQPGNYEVFRENARASGLLKRNKEFAFNSGKNQVLMYKEDIEANLRTPHIYGFEMLDLHDYLGQGTALVGVLDAFWESKGYVTAEEFRHFCSETVILARIPSYVYQSTDWVSIPVEVCHFGREDITGEAAEWEITAGDERLERGKLPVKDIPVGENTFLGEILPDFSLVKENTELTLTVRLGGRMNSWNLNIYVKKEETAESVRREETGEPGPENVLYTRRWEDAEDALKAGKRVVYSPYLTDMDYSCPPTSMRPVFWNAQMGPAWGRSLGLCMDPEHPLFAHFPTRSYGGWQWEDILQQARAFDTDLLPKKLKPIVTVIDDWNRNLPLALIYEGKLGKGRLLVVTANLEGSFDKRPAAWCLKQALLAYAASDRFCPDTRVYAGMIYGHLHPDNIMLDKGVLYYTDKQAVLEKREALDDRDPGNAARFRSDQYPFEIGIYVPEGCPFNSLTVVPDQKARIRESGIREYELIAYDREGEEVFTLKGTLEDSSLPKVIGADSDIIIFSGHMVLRVLSGHERGKRIEWKERADGWYPELTEDEGVAADIGALQFRMNPEDPLIGGTDEVFWSRSRKSRTKEIEN